MRYYFAIRKEAVDINSIESFSTTNPYGVTDVCSKITIDTPAILNLSNCFPSSGEYTLQYWIKSDSVTEIEAKTDGMYRKIYVNPTWTNYIETFTHDKGPDSNYIYFDFEYVGVFYLYGVKLESGRVASEWTPMPTNNMGLYKLSDKYSDSIGCDNGDWYIERNIERVLINYYSSGSWVSMGNQCYALYLDLIGNVRGPLPALCNRFAYSNAEIDDLTENTFTVDNDGTNTRVCFKTVHDTINAWFNWIGENETYVLLPSNQPTIYKLSNALQSVLDTLTVDGDLYSFITQSGAENMRSDLLVEPIVTGKINSDMTALIMNNSDDKTGFIYRITCKDEVINPVIYHTESNQFIKINGTFIANDIITIDTRQSRKAITKTYAGQPTNIINSLDSVSKWIELAPGYNHLSQTAEIGAEFMSGLITYTDEYEGV